MTDGAVRHRLRSATHELHRRLDAAVEASGSFRDLDRYAAFLLVMVRCHGWAEQHLRTLADLELSGHRSKVPAGLDDLRRLGRDGDLVTPAPDHGGLDDLGRDGLLGMLYVVEGSTLGAKSVHRLVSRRLPEAPVGFLGCYGNDVDVRWRRTSRYLDVSIENERRAEAGARCTFEHFLGEMS